MNAVSPPIRLASIVCMARNGVIGRDGGMPWHFPQDLNHFKTLTQGHPMVMGRKCFQSLGRLLPGRTHYVVSRQAGAAEGDNPLGPFFFTDIDSALKAARAKALETGVDTVFIIGGGEIYRQTMGVIDTLYVTKIDQDIAGDVVFPDIDWSGWKTVSQQTPADAPLLTFLTLVRN